jgi:hypothetical protein
LQRSFPWRRHLYRRSVALDQCVERGLTGHAEDVASNTGQLDVAALRQFQQPGVLGRLALDELAAISQ